MSAEDGLLKALGTMAREQDAEIVPDDLLRPPAPARQAELIDAAVAAISAPRPGQPELASRRRLAEIPRAGRRALGRWLAGLLVPAAATAGALFWMRAGERLPLYVASVSGGVSEVRSPLSEDQARPILLEPGAPVEVVLRPETTVTRPVDVRAFWTRDGRIAPWTPTIDRSDQGSFRLRGPADRPFGPGAGELVLVVAPPAALPTAIDAKALSAPPRRWQVVRQPVRWR